MWVCHFESSDSAVHLSDGSVVDCLRRDVWRCSLETDAHVLRLVVTEYNVVSRRPLRDAACCCFGRAVEAGG